MPQKSASKPKGRKGKIGKKKGQMLAYANERRREKSHVRRIERHLRRFPNDNVARQMLAHYRSKAGMHTGVGGTKPHH